MYNYISREQVASMLIPLWLLVLSVACVLCILFFVYQDHDICLALWALVGPKEGTHVAHPAPVVIFIIYHNVFEHQFQNLFRFHYTLNESMVFNDIILAIAYSIE